MRARASVCFELILLVSYMTLASKTGSLKVHAFERPVASGDDEANASYCLLISHHKNRPGDATKTR